ncbi:uncharacterized protein G2W53_007236 [Senna tora]|uniref:Uncharacterized protein n=1 Tax=Senna tora TaxID=362788 RepID=A0A835CE09_9FABA|nr:uncharacterized protein G2W53_007236 [Senna tora]
MQGRNFSIRNARADARLFVWVRSGSSLRLHNGCKSKGDCGGALGFLGLKENGPTREAVKSKTSA